MVFEVYAEGGLGAQNKYVEEVLTSLSNFFGGGDVPSTGFGIGL